MILNETEEKKEKKRQKALGDWVGKIRRLWIGSCAQLSNFYKGTIEITYFDLLLSTWVRSSTKEIAIVDPYFTTNPLDVFQLSKNTKISFNYLEE